MTAGSGFERQQRPEEWMIDAANIDSMYTEAGMGGPHYRWTTSVDSGRRMATGEWLKSL